MNGQALLGMSDTDVLNIIDINIDSIGAKDARDSEWCTNRQTIQGVQTKTGNRQVCEVLHKHGQHFKRERQQHKANEI